MKKILIVLLVILTCQIYSQNVSQSPYGINAHQAENIVLLKVKNAGIKWIRSDINWSYVERVKGVYDWQEVDRVVDYLHSQGFSILMAIVKTPGWANNNKGRKYPSADVTYWERFVGKAVQRYKKKIKYWSIWNEPNNQAFFMESKDVFVDKVFLPAAKKLKNIAPGAFIVGPDLAHFTQEGMEWYFWLKYILTNCKNYIDVVSHHIYKNEGAYLIYEILQTGKYLLPSVKDIVEETGNGSKPFWITETGWNTSDFSENMQSERYLEMLARMRDRKYPDKIFFYETIDDPTQGVKPWGIIRSNKKEKAAYTVYKDFIAGKYSDYVPDDNDIGEKDKCYADEVLNENRSKNNKGLIKVLRENRDTMIQDYPFGKQLSNLYYKYSNEFYKLAISDARIYKLGIGLLKSGSDYLVQADQYGIYSLKQENRFRLQVLPKVETLLKILEEKRLSMDFKKVINWGKKQHKLLRRIPLSEYLKFNLTYESLSLEK